MSPPPPVPDQAARAAEARWFAAEVQPHEPQLRAYLHRQFPSLRDTDDLVQESFIKIIRARQSGRILSVKNYLFGIARNAALSVFRRKATTHEIPLGDIRTFASLPDTTDVVAAVSDRQDLALVVEAMDELPDRCREVLILWALQGLSHPEIAARLNISEHTVRAQLAKGVKRCIEFMRTRGILKETS